MPKSFQEKNRREVKKQDKDFKRKTFTSSPGNINQLDKEKRLIFFSKYWSTIGNIF
jgi:hypothetical protein